MPTEGSTEAAVIDISRALDWRAQRARELVAQRRLPSPREDDRWTAALSAFYRHRERNVTGMSSNQRAAPAGLAEAVRLAEDPNILLRSVVEARLLAGVTAEGTAYCNGLPAEGIAWYEYAFFDVRERLVYQDYILASVIGPRPADTGEWAPLIWVWKRVAYLGGPACLENVLGLVGPGNPDTAQSLSVGALEAKRIMATQWTWAAISAVDPLDPGMVTRFAERLAQETSAEANTGPNTKFLVRAEAILKAYKGQLRVGGRGDPRVSNLRPFDEKGIELNWMEQVAHALGIPHPAEHLLEDGMPFPEPVREQAT